MLKQRSLLHLARFPALPQPQIIHVDSIEGERKGLSLLHSRSSISCIENLQSLECRLLRSGVAF